LKKINNSEMNGKGLGNVIFSFFWFDKFSVFCFNAEHEAI